MSTPYNIIANSFLNKITDDLLLTLHEEDLENVLDLFRSSASIKFKQCSKLSDRDENLRVYNSTLTDEEVEIVANLMVLEWLKQRVNSIELLKQGMSSRDYHIYSQAAHLDTLLKLRKETAQDVDRLIVSYTYSNNELSSLGKGVAYDRD